MSKQIRVNIRSNATSKPKFEKRNGRDVIVVSSATLPDNVVMNDILYPADEIANSYKTLERSPAPMGHPLINGKFVSASDPEGINGHWIGAWNENVRQEGGRVLLDKVIDVEVANRTEEGKALIDAINRGDPIHTSTGLLGNLTDAPAGSGAKSAIKNMIFDHDAILLNEQGAATPDQGVGMMVNAKGENEEIEVINSAIEDDAMRHLGYAVDDAIRAVEKLERAPMIERIKSAVLKVVRGEDEETAAQNEGASEMADDKKKIEELETKVNELSEGLAKMVGDAVQNAVKPLVDAQAEMKANQEAKDKAELDGLVNKIVKANIMGEDAAKELTLNVARELAKKAEPGTAAALNSAGIGGDGAELYDLNAVMGLTNTEKKEA